MEEDARAAYEEYRWLHEHEPTCARDLPVKIETWLGTRYTVMVCRECARLYDGSDPYPPATDLPPERTTEHPF